MHPSARSYGAMPLLPDERFRREFARRHLINFMEYDGRGFWRRARHLEKLCAVLEGVANGRRKRVMVFMPPRHGKSEVVSKKFPSWFIGNNPDYEMLLGSYSAELAVGFSRVARNTLLEHAALFGVQLASDSKAVNEWRIQGRRGGLAATGVDGSMTGKGAHVLVIDDPHKDAKEARSATIRDNVYEWYKSVARTRLAPGGAIVLLQTRWHYDDLAGRLLEDAKNGGEQWDVVAMPAYDEETGYLWPERFPSEEYEALRRTLGVLWDALYQQNPTREEGNFFKRQHFRYFRSYNDSHYELLTPDGSKYVDRARCLIFQTCDVAGSLKTSADYFVVGTFALTPENELLVLDIFRVRIEGPDQPALMRRLFHEWRPLIQGVESKNMGLTLFQQLKRDGLPIVELKADTDKVTRAIPAAARYSTGEVYHLQRAEWLEEFERELREFPSGAHDDQVDVVAYAVLVQLWGYLNRVGKSRDKAYVFG